MFKSQWAVQLQHLMPQFGFNKPRLLLYCGMENEIRGCLPAFFVILGRGNIFLNSLTTPPLRGTPPTEGNLAQCLIFYCVLLMCRSDALRPVRILVFVQTALPLVFTYSDSSRGSNRDRDDSVNAICVAFATTLFTGLLRCAAHDKRVCGCGNIFLYSLTTPPLRGTPP